MTFEDIRFAAFEARAMYKAGLIDRATAKEKIAPYVDAFNLKTVEIAKKYNMKPKKISFAGFVR